jgi:hypothetical protein
MPQRETSTAATLDPELEATPLRVVRAPAPFDLPDIPELKRVPRRIDAVDEGELRWFLGHPLVASIATSSGAFGVQLEQAESFGFGSLPCLRCGGKLRTRKRNGASKIVEWCEGTGMAPRDRFGKRVTYSVALAAYRVQMQREHGIVLMSRPAPKPESGLDADAVWATIEKRFADEGKTLMTDADFRQAFEKLPDDLTQPCRICDGIGIVPRRAASHVEVTAYPTGSSKQIGGKENDDAERLTRKYVTGRRMIEDGSARIDRRELDRYIGIRAILEDMARLSEIARVAVEEYYVEGGGQRALDRIAGELMGLSGAAMVRKGSELRDFSCGVYQLAAYGAGT